MKPHEHIWNIICIEFDNYISGNLALGKLESNGSRKRNFLEGFPTMMTTSMLCICISSFLLGWNIIEFPVETYKKCPSIFCCFHILWGWAKFRISRQMLIIQLKLNLNLWKSSFNLILSGLCLECHGLGWKLHENFVFFRIYNQIAWMESRTFF